MTLRRTLETLRAEVNLRSLRGQPSVSGDTHYMPAIRRLSRMEWEHARRLLDHYGLTDYVLNRTRNQDSTPPNTGALSYDAANIRGLIAWLRVTPMNTTHELAFSRRGIARPSSSAVLRIQAARHLRLSIRGANPTMHAAADPLNQKVAAELAYVQHLLRAPHEAAQAYEWLIAHSGAPSDLQLPTVQGTALRLAWTRATGQQALNQALNLAVHLAALGSPPARQAALSWLRREYPNHHLTGLLHEPRDHRHELRLRRRIDHQ